MTTLDLDSPEFLALQELVKAQQEANRLKEEELRATQAQITILRRKETLSLGEREETAHLRQEVREQKDKVAEMILALRELSEEISANVSAQLLLAQKVDNLRIQAEKYQVELDNNMILLLTEHTGKQKERAIGKIEQRISTRTELAQRESNLARLRERAAKYGALNVPLDVQNAITAEEDAISQLRSDS